MIRPPDNGAGISFTTSRTRVAPTPFRPAISASVEPDRLSRPLLLHLVLDPGEDVVRRLFTGHPDHQLDRGARPAGYHPKDQPAPGAFADDGAQPGQLPPTQSVADGAQIPLPHTEADGYRGGEPKVANHGVELDREHPSEAGNLRLGQVPPQLGWGAVHDLIIAVAVTAQTIDGPVPTSIWWCRPPAR